MTMTNFSENIDRLIFGMNGTFGEKVLKPKVLKLMLESILILDTTCR